MILVTGATGKVGRPLVAGLLAAGAPVRALTRDPATASLSAGAELAGFDPARPETLTAALAGVTAVFINLTAVGEVLADLMTAIRAAGLRRAVLLSSYLVIDDDEQPYWIGARHKAVEDAVADAVAEWTFLRAGGFATNTLAWAPMIRAGGPVRMPYPDAASAPVVERDIAAAAIPALLGDEHIGVRYALTGPQSLTQAEQVQVIGAAIGRDLVVAELPPEEFRQAPPAHLPPPAVDDMLQYLADHVGHGEPPTDLTTITGQPGTAFAVWAGEHAGSFR